MAAIDYRLRARRHFEAATALLASGDNAQLLYACLELRLTIEALAYEMVQLYRGDLDDAVLRTWQANKVLKELAQLDPGADGTVTIEIQKDEAADEWMTMVDERMTSAWVDEVYPKLGNFLHERTLIELERGKDTDRPVVRERAEEIAAYLQRVVNSTGWGFRFTFNITVECDCGGPLVFKFGHQQRTCRTRCEACGQPFEAERPPKFPQEGLEPGEQVVMRARRLNPAKR